jgi:5-methylcytosine-specific restriction endonuclease McrA
MIVVEPHEKVTLLLNNIWQPVTAITARATLIHLIKGRISALDKNSNIFHSFDSWMRLGEFTDEQPVLRSVTEIWPIPTVIVVTSKFFRRPRKKKLSLTEMAKVYDSTCQYCLKKHHSKDLTVDHIRPKSMGGSDDHNNRTLACKKCNTKKGSLYPFLNIKNETVKAPEIPHILIDAGRIREEWQVFL